jgi:hypothetical protein
VHYLHATLFNRFISGMSVRWSGSILIFGNPSGMGHQWCDVAFHVCFYIWSFLRLGAEEIDSCFSANDLCRGHIDTFLLVVVIDNNAGLLKIPVQDLGEGRASATLNAVIKQIRKAYNPFLTTTTNKNVLI